jgi:hypothetical protein
MKKLYTSIAIAVLLGVPGAHGATITPDQLSACESAYREKNKADNDAAPEGYKVKRDKGHKAKYIAECLSK